MPRFSANISMLFKEVEFPERFEAVAQAGFKAVEIQFPYGWSKRQLGEIAQRAGVEVVLINIPAGDPDKGDRGIACLPSRVAEFREGVARAINYARALGCKQMNCLAGVAPPEVAGAKLRETFVSNLRYAAGELARHGMTLLTEPVSTQAVPGFYLNASAQALALMDEADAANLKLQYDLYHMRIMGDDLAETLSANLHRIGAHTDRRRSGPARARNRRNRFSSPVRSDRPARLSGLDRRGIRARRQDRGRFGVGEEILVSCTDSERVS